MFSRILYLKMFDQNSMENADTADYLKKKTSENNKDNFVEKIGENMW